MTIEYSKKYVGSLLVNSRLVSHLRSNRAPICTNYFDLKFQTITSIGKIKTLNPLFFYFV